jgi:hypothetical protein
MIYSFFLFLEASSSNEESSSSLEEELPFVLLPLAFTLSFLFSVVSFSSLLIKSSKRGPRRLPTCHPLDCCS